MKIIISPAKLLVKDRTELDVKGTQPAFWKEAVLLNDVLMKYSREQLSTLMRVSAQIADLSYQRFQDFDKKNRSNNCPAMFLYDGSTYHGLDAYTIAQDRLEDFQDQLRIISGLYGLLKPLDLIQPYRLEMKTKLLVEKHKNLYSFWTDKITNALNDELKDGELLLNLASKEYSKAIKMDHLKSKVVSPVFKTFKNGKLKVISFCAKEARGAMARHVIENGISDIDEILASNVKGYLFSPDETRKADEPVFVR